MTTTDYTLDELVGIEDALEAIRDGVNRSTYTAMHDGQSRELADRHFDAALAELWAYDTNRKALNAVRRAIESYR